VLAGWLADTWSLTTAIVVVAAITAASGLDIVVRMRETHPRHARTAAAGASAGTLDQPTT